MTTQTRQADALPEPRRNEAAERLLCAVCGFTDSPDHQRVFHGFDYLRGEQDSIGRFHHEPNGSVLLWNDFTEALAAERRATVERIIYRLDNDDLTGEAPFPWIRRILDEEAAR